MEDREPQLTEDEDADRGWRVLACEIRGTSVRRVVRHTNLTLAEAEQLASDIQQGRGRG